MKTSDRLEIKHVAIKLLKELPGNPRYWSDKATKDLTESINHLTGAIAPQYCHCLIRVINKCFPRTYPVVA